MMNNRIAVGSQEIEKVSFSYPLFNLADMLYLCGKVGAFPTEDESMKNEIDLMALTEKELRELFKKVDWSEIDPTIEEIEDELENEVDRFMSLSVKQYRKELGFN
jgi:hypothetical protein